MSEPIQKFRKKDFVVGYTGHVPKKQLLFGMPAGELGKLLRNSKGVDLFYKGKIPRHGEKPANNNVSVDNIWIGGPTSKFLPQHVPGYTGHVPAIKAENLFAKSYARTTTKAKKLGTFRQNKFTDRQRLRSHADIEFNKYNFTRFLKEPELSGNKDYADYASYVNRELNNSEANTCRLKALKNEEILATEYKSNRNPYNSVIISRLLKANKDRAIEEYQNRALNNSVRVSSTDHFSTSYGDEAFKQVNTSPIKPRLVESRLAVKPSFLNMSNGFQKVFAKDKDDQEIRIPIAGYQGHRVGYHSKNIYGKPFRNCSIESKRIQRFHRAQSSCAP